MLLPFSEMRANAEAGLQCNFAARKAGWKMVGWVSQRPSSEMRCRFNGATSLLEKVISGESRSCWYRAGGRPLCSSCTHY